METPTEEMTTWERHVRAASERRRFVESKNGLDYFPWMMVHAWLMRSYPGARWGTLDPQRNEGAVGMTARVWLRLDEGEEEWVVGLAVADFRNNCIPEPTQKDLDDTSKRAFVKAVAIATGIGAELYMPSMRGSK